MQISMDASCAHAWMHPARVCMECIMLATMECILRASKCRQSCVHRDRHLPRSQQLTHLTNTCILGARCACPVTAVTLESAVNTVSKNLPKLLVAHYYCRPVQRFMTGYAQAVEAWIFFSVSQVLKCTSGHVRSQDGISQATSGLLACVCKHTAENRTLQAWNSACLLAHTVSCTCIHACKHVRSNHLIA